MLDFLTVSICGRLWTLNWDDDVNRLLADDEVGASQESGGGINFNYIPFSKLGPPARATGGGKGRGTGDRVLGTGYWVLGRGY